MHVAVGRAPSSGGHDPGYLDFRKWRWPVVVEFGNTTPGTLEARLHRFTFSPTEQRTPGPPARCRL